MSATKYYTNLPGFTTQLFDGGQFTPNEILSDSVLLVGTSYDGPLYEAHLLRNLARARYNWGDSTVGNFSALRGVQEASNAGARNLGISRMSGRRAYTILLDGDASHNPALNTSLTVTSLTTDGSTRVFDIENASGVNHKWLSRVVFSSGLSTEVEGVDFHVNYKDGKIEFVTAPSAGTWVFNVASDKTESWQYSIELESVWPGDLYNSSYASNTTTEGGQMIVTVTSDTITITKPASKGSTSIAVTYAATDTYGDVARKINVHRDNNFVRAIVRSGQSGETVSFAYTANFSNGIPLDSAEVTTHSAVTASIVAPFITADHKPASSTVTELWSKDGTYRRFHYGDSEQEMIANVPGVTGFRQSLTSTTNDGRHGINTFTQDIYNLVVRRGDYIVEYTNNGATGSAPTQTSTKSDDGVLDWIELVDPAWIVPYHQYADATVYRVSSASTPTVASTSFAEIWGEFAQGMYDQGNHCMIALGLSPLNEVTPSAINTKMTADIATRNGLTLQTNSARTGLAIDTGKYLVLTGGPEGVTNVSGLGKIHSDGAPLFAGFVSTLSPIEAATNKPAVGVLDLKYNPIKRILDAYTEANIVCLRRDERGAIVWTADPTLASNVSDSQASTFSSVMTMRIVKSILNGVKIALAPFIGTANSVPIRQAMKAAIATVLQTAYEMGAITYYSFNLTSALNERRLATVTVDLTISPAPEIYKIVLSLTVK